MSKKKSTLDDELIGKQEKPKSSVTSGNETNLKEFSKTGPFSFSKANYMLLLIGLGINILGFILMIGGATDDPNVFKGDELFSTMRITISPMLIVIGYVVIGYAIMKRPKSTEE